MGLNELIKIGDRIKYYRKKLNITQAEMADKIGLPRSTYAHYENNTREPNNETLLKIVKIFGIDIHELLNIYNVDYDDKGNIKSFKVAPTKKELLSGYFNKKNNALSYFIDEVTQKYNIVISYNESELDELNNYLIKQTLLKLSEFKDNNIILKAESQNISYKE